MRRRITILPPKRKRLGKTDYRLRFRLASSGKPRLVIRKSLKNILAQIIIYQKGGDCVVASAHSNELKKYGLEQVRRDIPVAYLVGYLVGRKAAQKKIREAILDIGLYRVTKGSLLFAALKGTLDAGITIAHGNNVFPSEDRIKGKHLKNVVSVDSIIKNIQQELGADHGRKEA